MYVCIINNNFFFRYESPIGASPSRNLDHQKPFYDEEMFDRSTSYRGSLGKSLGNAPSYNGKFGKKKTIHIYTNIKYTI